MSLEAALISKVLDEGSITLVQAHKIESSQFSPEYRVLYNYILEHAHNPEHFGQVPSREKMERTFSHFKYVTTKDSLESLCSEFRNIQLSKQLRLMADELYELLDEDPARARAFLINSAATVIQQGTETKDTDVFASLGTVLDTYDAVKSCNGLLGLPYPWPALTEESMGIQKGEYIVITGRPGTMKTWLLLEIALKVYLSFGKVLFVTNEMSEDQIKMRIAARVAKLDYEAVRKAKLDPLAEDRFRSAIQMVQTYNDADSESEGRKCGFIIVKPSETEKRSAAFIRRKITEYRPDIVCIDGVYLMDDDKDSRNSKKNEQVGNISREMKKIAARTETAIIVTSQINREGEKVKSTDEATGAHVAYSDAITQDADLILRSFLDKSNMTITIVILKSREFNMGRFAIKALPAVTFQQIDGPVGMPTADDSSEEEDFAGSDRLSRMGASLRPKKKIRRRDE